MVKGVNLELNDIVGILTYPCMTAFFSPGCKLLLRGQAKVDFDAQSYLSSQPSMMIIGL